MGEGKEFVGKKLRWNEVKGIMCLVIFSHSGKSIRDSSSKLSFSSSTATRTCTRSS